MKKEGHSINRGVIHKLIILLKLCLCKVDAYSNMASSVDLFQLLKMYKK
jgi:hypothetical protein